jgi:hypothetical protein
MGQPLPNSLQIHPTCPMQLRTCILTQVLNREHLMGRQKNLKSRQKLGFTLTPMRFPKSTLKLLLTSILLTTFISNRHKNYYQSLKQCAIRGSRATCKKNRGDDDNIKDNISDILKVLSVNHFYKIWGY